MWFISKTRESGVADKLREVVDVSLCSTYTSWSAHGEGQPNGVCLFLLNRCSVENTIQPAHLSGPVPYLCLPPELQNRGAPSEPIVGSLFNVCGLTRLLFVFPFLDFGLHPSFEVGHLPVSVVVIFWRDRGDSLRCERKRVSLVYRKVTQQQGLQHVAPLTGVARGGGY